MRLTCVVAALGILACLAPAAAQNDSRYDSFGGRGSTHGVWIGSGWKPHGSPGGSPSGEYTLPGVPRIDYQGIAERFAAEEDWYGRRETTVPGSAFPPPSGTLYGPDDAERIFSEE